MIKFIIFISTFKLVQPSCLPLTTNFQYRGSQIYRCQEDGYDDILFDGQCQFKFPTPQGMQDREDNMKICHLTNIPQIRCESLSSPPQPISDGPQEAVVEFVWKGIEEGENLYLDLYLQLSCYSKGGSRISMNQQVKVKADSEKVATVFTDNTVFKSILNPVSSNDVSGIEEPKHSKEKKKKGLNILSMLSGLFVEPRKPEGNAEPPKEKKKGSYLFSQLGEIIPATHPKGTKEVAVTGVKTQYKLPKLLYDVQGAIQMCAKMTDITNKWVKDLQAAVKKYEKEYPYWSR
jgi:hypothetical protein